jgi:hypothetical protein
MPWKYTVKTKGTYWLRQQPGTDIRKVVAGNVFWFTNMAMAVAPYPLPLGELIVHYNLTYSMPTAKELSYTSAYSAGGQSFGTSATLIDWSLGEQEEPFSAVVLPYISDTMVAPVPPGLLAQNVLVMNHGSVTPRGTFVQMQIYITGSNLSTVAINYYIGGILSNGLRNFDMGITNGGSSQGGAYVYTFYIPPNTPTDAAQVTISATCTIATTMTWAVWTLESTLFEGDFAPPGDAPFKLPMRFTRTLSNTMKRSVARSKLEEKKEEEDIPGISVDLHDQKEEEEVDMSRLVIRDYPDPPVIGKGSPVDSPVILPSFGLGQNLIVHDDGSAAFKEVKKAVEARGKRSLSERSS